MQDSVVCGSGVPLRRVQSHQAEAQPPSESLPRAVQDLPGCGARPEGGDRQAVQATWGKYHTGKWPATPFLALNALIDVRWHKSGSCCVQLFVQAGYTMQSWLCPGMSGVVHCPGRVLVAASFHRLDADNHRCCACCCRLLVRLCGPA